MAPASKFQAPQTMSCGSPPVVTRHNRSLSALGWGETSSTRPTITPENSRSSMSYPSTS